MSLVDWSTRGRLDLLEAWEFIARDSERSADRFVLSVEKWAEGVARAPKIGRARPELGEGLRSRAYGRYLLFYRVTPDGIRIIRFVAADRWLDLLDFDAL